MPQPKIAAFLFEALGEVLPIDTTPRGRYIAEHTFNGILEQELCTVATTAARTCSKKNVVKNSIVLPICLRQDCTVCYRSSLSQGQHHRIDMPSEQNLLQRSHVVLGYDSFFQNIFKKMDSVQNLTTSETCILRTFFLRGGLQALLNFSLDTAAIIHSKASALLRKLAVSNIHSIVAKKNKRNFNEMTSGVVSQSLMAASCSERVFALLLGNLGAIQFFTTALHSFRNETGINCQRLDIILELLCCLTCKITRVISRKKPCQST